MIQIWHKVIQYAVKLIVPLLAARARLQHKFGLKETATSRAAEGWSKLGVLVGDARALWRIWGITSLSYIISTHLQLCSFQVSYPYCNG